MEAFESLKCRKQVVEHYFAGYNTAGLEPKRIYIAKAVFDVNYLFLMQKRFISWFFVILAAMLLDWKRNSPHCLYILKTRLKAKLHL